jgi:methylglutaconyl-CoA hydratase
VWGLPINHSLIEDTAKRLAHRRVSAEGKEGIKALLARRKPSWTL